MTKRVGPWRRLVGLLQGAVMLGLPFVRINGESALRFDIPSLTLHFLGVSLWMEEFFIVLAALVFFTFLIILVTILFGRIWCGWFCPQTVIGDLTLFVERAGKMGALYRLASYPAMALASGVVAISLIWYFVSPYDFFYDLARGRIGPVVAGFWIVLTILIFLDFMFVRQKFCATVCPYSRLQSVLYDKGTLVIAFDPDRSAECGGCDACVRVCPVKMDIKEGLDPACINCARCVDECSAIMERKEKKSLVGYFWGLPGEARGRGVRPGVAVIGVTTSAFLVLTLYLALSRTSFDVTVLPNRDFTPTLTLEGRAVNSYVLAFRNRANSDIAVEIGVSGGGAGVTITPVRVTLARGGDVKRVVAYASMKEANRIEGKSFRLGIKFRSTDDYITRMVNFHVPEA